MAVSSLGHRSAFRFSLLLRRQKPGHERGNCHKQHAERKTCACDPECRRNAPRSRACSGSRDATRSVFTFFALIASVSFVKERKVGRPVVGSVILVVTTIGAPLR